MVANDERFFSARFNLDGSTVDDIEMQPYGEDRPFGLPMDCGRGDILLVMGEPFETTVEKLSYIDERKEAPWSQVQFGISGDTEKLRAISIYCGAAITGKPKEFGHFWRVPDA